MKTLEIPVFAGSKLVSNIEVGEHLRVLDHGSEAPHGSILWRILTKKGDEIVTWNTDSFVEIAEAAALFKSLIAAGMVPYVCGVDGRPTEEVMTEFDSSAGMVSFKEVLFVPKKLAAGG